MKRCSKCGRRRARRFFYIIRKSRGLRAACKFCESKDKKVYRAANLEKITTQQKIRDARYYAKKRKASGDFTPSQWFDKCRFFGWRCYLCGKALTVKTATVEHRKPLSKGGANFIANVAPACFSYNSGKREKSEVEARKRINAMF